MSARVPFRAAARCKTVAMGMSLAAVFACKKDDSGAPFEGEILMHTTGGGRESDMTVLVRGDKLRFEMKAEDGQLSHGLFDPSTNRVTMILDAQKAYMDMDFGKPSAMPNTDPGTSTVTKQGVEQIAGRSCESYRVADPAGKQSEVCVAAGLAFFDLSSLRPGGGGAPVGLAKEFKDKKSFPLRSVEYDKDGKEISRMVVTKIERKAEAASLFEVPADYKKLEIAKPGLPRKE